MNFNKKIWNKNSKKFKKKIIKIRIWKSINPKKYKKKLFIIYIEQGCKKFLLLREESVFENVSLVKVNMYNGKNNVVNMKISRKKEMEIHLHALLHYVECLIYFHSIINSSHVFSKNETKKENEKWLRARLVSTQRLWLRVREFGDAGGCGFKCY